MTGLSDYKPYDNFMLLGQNLPVRGVLQQIEQSHAWDWLNLRKMFPRTPHRESSDIILRFAPLQCPITFRGIMDGLECVNYWPWYDLDGVRLLIDHAFGRPMESEIGRVMVTRLSPGKQVYPHADEGQYSEHFDRYHIVLSAGAGECIFECGGEQIIMNTGDFWKFNHQKIHSVHNAGQGDRITLIVDVRRH
jgi:quercetin dioxygenase-like cupin family protein